MGTKVRETVLVSLNVSLKWKAVRETFSGILPANLIHLSECLSKVREIKAKLERRAAF